MNIFVLLSSSANCSYQWIKRKGKPAPREIAPIIVSNHVSYIEPIFYFYELFPTIVASESHDSIPFVGTIIRAMQVISFIGYVLCMHIHKYKVYLPFSHFPFLPLLCFQVIYVNRFLPSSRRQTIRDIKVKHFYFYAYCYLVYMWRLLLFDY